MLGGIVPGCKRTGRFVQDAGRQIVRFVSPDQPRLPESCCRLGNDAVELGLCLSFDFKQVEPRATVPRVSRAAMNEDADRHAPALTVKNRAMPGWVMATVASASQAALALLQTTLGRLPPKNSPTQVRCAPVR